MSSIIGIPKEIYANEKRVASVPDVVEKLIKLGFAVIVESGAGDLANFADDTYVAAGAKIVGSAADLWNGANIVFKVRAPSMEEVALIKEGTTLIGFIWPAQNPELMQALAARKITVLAMDCVPRQLGRAFISLQATVADKDTLKGAVFYQQFRQLQEGHGIIPERSLY